MHRNCLKNTASGVKQAFSHLKLLNFENNSYICDWRMGSATGRNSFLIVKETLKRMAEVHYMTQEGLDKLRKDLADALAQRPVISAAIAEAREKGDLSENAEYDAARDAQGLLEVKIAKFKELVANAKVIDESMVGTDTVQMTNKVKIQNMANNQVMEFTIVGETEADFAHGKMAATTPIAKALLGHGKGEVVEAKVPQGVIKFKILEISLG